MLLHTSTTTKLLFLDMDNFVRTKLEEWGLEDLIERFKGQGINKRSLYCLKDQEIDELIPRIGPRSIFKEELSLLRAERSTTNQETADTSDHHPQEHEEAAEPTQVQPSTSGERVDKGKRKSDLQEESSEWQSPTSKQRLDTIVKTLEVNILSKVKGNMADVLKKLEDQDETKFISFLRKKICYLETDKKEQIGVFGKTGAGKSSLINVIIGENDLLPTGRGSACTSVMIKVETNMHSLMYEAEIEFITKEEWKDELWPLYHIPGDNTDQESHINEYRDTVEKLSALYGEDIGRNWKNTSREDLMKNKHFKEIPEFVNSKPKILECESADELSAKVVKYTRSDQKQGEGKEVKRCYWPLVKCVTVRVPKNDLLQHVTLVDLPGNGDRNKGRDRMWKELVGSCSTVWIVSETNRAASEEEAWEILESACSLMGNGGECQRIHFICTKSDDVGVHSAVDVRKHILETNMETKEKVKRKFKEQESIKKHFSDECFKVFTVSSKAFLERTILEKTFLEKTFLEKQVPEKNETEIPELQDFLKSLNENHSETSNYVSGAHGILSLIQGARRRDVGAKKMDVCKNLEEKLKQELDEVRKFIEKSNEAFDRCLTEGVEKSKSSCEEKLKSIIEPENVTGSAFHRTLRRVVESNGTYKPKKGKQINLNVTLSSCLTGSIDDEFRKTFPNEAEREPFNEIIKKFSLNTQGLLEMSKDVELQLIFLKTEEDQIKTKLNTTIRERKKKIYNSLVENIEETMKESYKKAAEFRGTDSLKNMRDTLKTHVSDSKNTMFEEAKATMLNQLNELKEEILDKLEKTLTEAIELSLTDDDSIPDVSDELERVKKHYSELKPRSTNITY